jgi:hypothetical protein
VSHKLQPRLWPTIPTQESIADHFLQLNQLQTLLAGNETNISKKRHINKPKLDDISLKSPLASKTQISLMKDLSKESRDLC